MTFLSILPSPKSQEIHEGEKKAKEAEISWEDPGTEPDVESQACKTEEKITYKI